MFKSLVWCVVPDHLGRLCMGYGNDDGELHKFCLQCTTPALKSSEENTEGENIERERTAGREEPQIAFIMSTKRTYMRRKLCNVILCPAG